LNNVYLGIGSNVGKKEQNINKAIDLLKENDFIEVKKVSSLITTKAVANGPQPDYINGAIEIKTILTAYELLKVTKDIEKKIGRTDKGNNDPREIDIDLLFFEDQIISENNLIIPHPLIHEREFVLIPMKEIASNYIHPVLNETIESLHEKLIGY
jgi:2-amino-4-hydroxy-6-hydroxymethyldihydropteridine diphosphokinase